MLGSLRFPKLTLATSLIALTAWGCAPSDGYGDGGDPSDGYTDGDYEGEGHLEEGSIAIDRSVSIGAFQLDFGTLRFGETEALFGPVAFVEVDFVSHNLSTYLQTPLANLWDDALLLEAAGTYAYGEVDADAVPGLRDGTGTISWYLDLGTVTPASLEEAVITLGFADQNQVVIPLADLDALISLNGFDIPAPEPVRGYRQTTLEIDQAGVHFNAINANEPAPAGKAYLVFDALLSADADMGRAGQYWGVENVYLTRPDGVSVAPASLNEAIYPGDRTEISLVFELEQPVSGTYELGVTDPDLEPVTRTIEIP